MNQPLLEFTQSQSKHGILWLTIQVRIKSKVGGHLGKKRKPNLHLS